MYTDKQAEIIERIQKNFYEICNQKGVPNPANTIAYERDISLLCSDEFFTPEVLNFAMDLMWKLSDQREKNDTMNLAMLEEMTYANFRIGPSYNEKEGNPS